MITNNYYNDAVYSNKHHRYVNYQIEEQGENFYGQEQNSRTIREVCKRKDHHLEQARRRNKSRS
jgi:capsid protein